MVITTELGDLEGGGGLFTVLLVAVCVSGLCLCLIGETGICGSESFKWMCCDSYM